MKTIFDFMYCEGELTPQVVHYLVPVGQSLREQRACRSLVELTKGDTRYFFCRHSLEVANFLHRCRQSFQPSVSPLPGHYVFQFRTCRVSPQWLLSFIKNNPPALLNSQRIVGYEKILKTA